MRKAIAILCLAVFFTLQYGKLVNYWHCKISAAIAAVHCDCEKVLVDAHISGFDHSATSVVSEKTEEIYLLHELHYDCSPVTVLLDNSYSFYTSRLPASDAASIFQPPRA